MSKASNWMPLFVGDYMADTGHLSTSEHGAYLLLLMHQWRNGAIPDDEKQIARIVRCSIAEWRKMAETILAFFAKTDSGWSQGRLERERARADDMADRRADKGRKAAKARWTADATSMPDACSTHAPSIAQAMPKPCPTPLPVEETPSPPSVVRSPSGVRLPDGWLPSDTDSAFARSLGLDPSAVGDRFRDYWRGKPGKDGRKSDWPATWRNWCRRDASSRQSPSQGKPMSALGQWAALMAVPPETTFDFDGQAEEIQH